MNAPDLFRAEWRKSSRSGGGPNCVEVAWAWRKSSRSGTGPSCVEVAWSPESFTAVRDSKYPTGPVLTFPVAAWAAFLRS
jgi:hypothetical protein